jgi:hypothetical protein
MNRSLTDNVIDTEEWNGFDDDPLLSEPLPEPSTFSTPLEPFPDGLFDFLKDAVLAANR